MKTAKTIKIVFSLTAVGKKLSFALSTGNFGSILKEPIFDCFGGPIKIGPTWKQRVFLRPFEPPAQGLSMTMVR